MSKKTELKKIIYDIITNIIDAICFVINPILPIPILIVGFFAFVLSDVFSGIKRLSVILESIYYYIAGV